MGLWHVYDEGRQIECCGTPFAVGEEVSLPLLLADAGEVLGGGWHDQLTKVAGPVDDVLGGEGMVRVVREETGLTVALREEGACEEAAREKAAREEAAQEEDRLRPGDWVRLVGLLTVERHGGEWPEVTGTVRAIQVLTQGFARSGDGAWEPVARERSLRSVPRCPASFTEEAVRADGVRPQQQGVMITLEVPGTDSWLSYAVREARGTPHTHATPGTETSGLPARELTALLETLSTVPGPTAGP